MSSKQHNHPQQTLHTSHHSACRQRQRGLTDRDIALILNFGERVDDGFVMSRKAIDDARQQLKQALQRLDHLRGATVIEQEGTLVTTYRADDRRLRRLRQGDALGNAARMH